jgi:ABC-type Na+ transport system ATPase subunit NatA
MNPVVRQLVRKDVRLNLPLMILMTGAGLLALVLMFAGRIGFAVGGIFIGMFCIVQERKDQSSLFALSLPVTVREFGAVKLLAALLIFGVPWLLLTLASFALTLLLPRRWAPNALLAVVTIGGCAVAGRSVGFAPLALRLRGGHLVGGARADGSRAALPREREPRAPLPRRLFLLALPCASAGGRRLRGGRAALARALEPEVRLHPWREPRGAARELSPAGAPELHRPRLERTHGSGVAPADRGGRRRACRRARRLGRRRGELLALLGPNGAGKSTAIGLWLGLSEADAGTVRLMGGSPHDMACRRRIGVMMQDVGFAHGMRVRELVAQTSGYYINPRPVDETLALAICGRPDLLFLYEPSVGFDVEARSTLWATIRQLLKEECSIVLTTHYLEEAEALADRVTVLAQGRVIASGAVDEIRCESVPGVEQLQAWPGVLAASRDAQRLCLTVADAESVLRRLLAEAFAQLTKEAA